MESNLEIEYKFHADTISKVKFHSKIESIMNQQIHGFLCISCDDYYVKNGVEGFLRHRKGGSKHELTLKTKRNENTVRKEVNIDLGSNDDQNIVEFLVLSGYRKKFSIFKEAWVYELGNCDLSFYTLSDGRSFIEIEATKYNSEEEGVAIIDKWKDLLSLEDSQREKRSLFEIFSDEESCNNNCASCECT